jgi:hypothetical protein
MTPLRPIAVAASVARSVMGVALRDGPVVD